MLRLILSASLTCLALTTSVIASDERPNIVLILADDLGYSDIASYGSEIETPHIDALADAGVRFTNYHTAASCAPTRSMLLTGVDSHRNGVPNIPEMLPQDQLAQDNYKGVLNRNVATVASILQSSGYHTYMTGKWHLGKEPDNLPYFRGFERTFAMGDSGADNWEKKPYIPIYKDAFWTADGKETDLPEDFYSSEFLIDTMIEFIDRNKGDDQPFFAYVPFQAVHIPVQAPQEFIDKYMGTYGRGWQVLREQRQQRIKELGIVAKDTEMVSMSTTGDWDSQDAETKKYQSKRMAVYAGMVDAMDHHIGRLIAYLKKTGQYDNTIFIFTSDNGSEPSGVDRVPSAINNAIMRRSQGYTAEYETLGLKGSMNSLGPSFASASASPLSFYKFYAGEGGMRVPLIISGKGISRDVDWQRSFSYVTDITPTILDLTGVSQPGQFFGGRHIEQMIGKSLVPLLNKATDNVYGASDTVGYELGGNKVLFQGNYKLVYNIGPVGDNQWYLYDIAKDPGETKDLAARETKRFQAMLNAYQRYAKDNNVLPIPEGYNQYRQIILNGLRTIAKDNILLFLLTIAVLVPFMLYARSHGRRRQ